MKTKTKKQSPYYWLAEPVLELPSLIEKGMFGCDAFYVNGRLQLVLCPGEEEPWKGVLFPVEREMHPGLIKDLPALSPHPVLGKWLYLSESSSDFEEVVQQWVNLILADDARIGVLPEAERGGKRRKRKKNGG